MVSANAFGLRIAGSIGVLLVIYIHSLNGRHSLMGLGILVFRQELKQQRSLMGLAEQGSRQEEKDNSHLLTGLRNSGI